MVALAARLASAVRPGGALIVFGKTRAASGRLQDFATQAYDEHKLGGGYSPGEILTKARSLRGVLTPLTSAQNVRLLFQAGLETVEIMHRHLPHLGLKEATV